MPDLPIYPEKRETPEYALERRLARLHEHPEDSYQTALEALRLECARETLRLTGGREDAEDEARDLFRAQLEALGVIEASAVKMSIPGVALIREVHRIATPGVDGSFRTDETSPQFKTARPSPPQFVEAKLDNLLDWLSGESGKEMFAAARMALWFARFVEIAPFERANFRTAHLVSNFFAVSAGFPPITLRLDEAEAVRSEVERAIQFDTTALVERFSGALSTALRECEEAAERASG